MMMILNVLNNTNSFYFWRFLKMNLKLIMNNEIKQNWKIEKTHFWEKMLKRKTQTEELIKNTKYDEKHSFYVTNNTNKNGSTDKMLLQ